MRMSLRSLLPLAGFAAVILLWSLGAALLARSTPLGAHFAPLAALQALVALLQGGLLWEHMAVSLKRVVFGLGYALAFGVPLGVATGISFSFGRITGGAFQFLRMISPLSWMPVAVMVLGVGDAPVYFLLAFAAVWPILLNTAAGVSQLDRNWLVLAASLAATRWETIVHVILPGITAHILTGVRWSITSK